jgi:basic membrane lipoprotein Med (substrate-binding protein (PBP1-ABC) superfamily)
MPASGQRAVTGARARHDRQRQAPRGASQAPLRGWARVSAWWRRLSLRARWLTALAALAAFGGLTAGLVATFTGSPAVGERQYLSFTGCLLTDSDGINGQPAAAAWAGLQSAAAATRMQAQYLAVPANAASASPYLASLVIQHCGLVVAAGSAQAAAVAGDASRFKSVRFVVIGGSASGTNVSVVTVGGGAAAVQSDVNNLARAAVAAAG